MSFSANRSLTVDDFARRLAGYRVQPVAAGCIIGWDVAFAADAVSPYQYTGAHFADLGRMTG